MSLSEIGWSEEIPETADSIKGNAVLKARAVYEALGRPCFADDTGLEVTALNGAPGVFSARYAGPERNSEANMNLLLSELKTKTDRSAQFKTVVALHYNGEIITFEGICEGEITKEKKGAGGFGYDPIFKPLENKFTFAELLTEQKNQIGHRGKAVRKLVTYLNFV